MKNLRLPCLLGAVTLLFISAAGSRGQDLPATQGSPQSTLNALERQYGRASIKVTNGLKVELGNRTTGRIAVKGWDRDVVEAHARSQRGDEVLIIGNSGDSSNRWIFLKADYADLDHAEARTNRLNDPPALDGRTVKIDLEVNMPRYAVIELIRVMHSEVEITGMETPVAVSGRWSSVTLKHVRSASVQTRSGQVEIEDANGLVEVATSSGGIKVHKAKGAVRLVSISGPIEIKCASGRIEVANTEAPIDLINVSGDVDANATSSSLRFTGDVSGDGRYHLKSMSGSVEMLLPSNTQGFNAVLSSYRGIVETNFALNTGQATNHKSLNRRVTGRFGKGNAQIALDSFEGLVRLTRAVPGSLAKCR